VVAPLLELPICSTVLAPSAAPQHPRIHSKRCRGILGPPKPVIVCHTTRANIQTQEVVLTIGDLQQLPSSSPPSEGRTTARILLYATNTWNRGAEAHHEKQCVENTDRTSTTKGRQYRQSRCAPTKNPSHHGEALGARVSGGCAPVTGLNVCNTVPVPSAATRRPQTRSNAAEGAPELQAQV